MKTPLPNLNLGNVDFPVRTPRLDQPQGRKYYRLLVVDDDQRHRESLRDLISLAGFQAAMAGSGHDALEMLNQEHYDLMLLDLRMPEIDGHQILDHIKSHGLDTGVIIVSGEPSWDEATRTLRRGADDFIRKPYAPDEVIAAIENSLKKRRLEQENRRIQEQLRMSEKLHRFIVNNSPDLIYILDQNGHFRFLNQRVESLLGHNKKDLLNKHYSELLFDADQKDLLHMFDERRTGERATRNLELRLKRKVGESENGPEYVPITMELSSMGVYSHLEGKEKQFIGTYGVARDITERKKAEDMINFQAYHDLLTGLPNRALFKDRLGLAIRQAARDKTRLAVMFLDLDRFKLVNDTLGHTCGDLLLQSVANRIQSTIRKVDTLSRIGGDEFTLLLPKINHEKDAALIADKIVAALKPPFLIEEHELYVRASIGIALYPEHGSEIDTLIKRADMAMYEVKSKGRDGYVFYSDQLDTKYANRLYMESSMRRALSEDQFVVHYQPMVRLDDGSPTSLEALIRWNHPEKGMVDPGEFIACAEENGMIIPIGRWVLKQVLSDLSKWRQQGLPFGTVAVNISASQLEHPEFLNMLVELLETYKVPGSCLELEITENVIMKDMEAAVAQLKKLARYGVKFAIDDFGTGYSSLSYLKSLPINTLKMDQSFVDEITEDIEEESIVSAIAAMARGLHLKLVAEGVEKEIQANYLRSIGCDQAQGFLYSTPMDFSRTTSYLSSNR